MSVCSCKAERQRSRIPKLLFEALSQYPYASTKLLFLHPPHRNWKRWRGKTVSKGLSGSHGLLKLQLLNEFCQVILCLTLWLNEQHSLSFTGSSPYWVCICLGVFLTVLWGQLMSCKHTGFLQALSDVPLLRCRISNRSLLLISISAIRLHAG